MINIRGAKVFETFRKGSRTYFISSLFFPHQERCDIFRIYAFVRVADNFVDQKPQKKKELQKFIHSYRQAMKGNLSKDEVINEFVIVVKRLKIPEIWIESFIKAMETDLVKTKYKNWDELEKYMYGSAEVIGLFVAKSLKLPKKAYKTAKMLGKAMQLANFIRDIDEDNCLGRQYIPLSVLKKYKFSSLDKKEILKRKVDFKKLIRECISVYYKWQEEAEEGFKYISKRNLVPVKTASDMYKWTMDEVYKNPLIVFENKVKPSKSKVISAVFRNALSI